jgi:hypothetical protein
MIRCSGYFNPSAGIQEQPKADGVCGFETGTVSGTVRFGELEPLAIFEKKL